MYDPETGRRSGGGRSTRRQSPEKSRSVARAPSRQSRGVQNTKMPGTSARIMDALGTSEITKGGANLGKCLLAELIGVLFINLFGCMAIIASETNAVQISLTFGFAVMASIHAIGHVSGGHLNPAVTIAAVVGRRVTIIRGLLYIIAQCLGAILGVAILKVVTPSENQKSLGLTQLNDSLSIHQGLIVEFLLGLILVFVVHGVTDPNKPDARFIAPLAIGTTVLVGHLACLQYTGSSMNPARSLGSAVVSNTWKDIWVYWVGPIGGGIAAALIYIFLFAAPPLTPRYSPVQMKSLDRKDEELP